jgi:hypothetical protein
MEKIILLAKSNSYQPLAIYRFEQIQRFLVHSAKIGKLLPFFLCKLLPLSGKEVINFLASFLMLTITPHKFLALPHFFIDAINHPGTNRGSQSLT